MYMADGAAITLAGVSKKYRLYESARHRLYEALHPFQRRYHREFWALRDIDLEIERGSTVGILGVNGSGKSTLLQIICSVLQPSTGTVSVDGRVAALIELGAGFNPEMTGRENAEMNSIIMGLTTRGARSIMPAIEAFADIGEFFDQPVKTYSSGMFMRVAFSTAIHVDPDILIIDEALAVGDARFQQKCFRKFREFQGAGKTILLVTHDRSAVPRLCTHAILLNRGRILGRGSPKDVTDQYSRLLTHGGDELPVAAGPSQHESVVAEYSPATALDAFLADLRLEDRCARNPTYNKNEVRYGLGGAAIIDYLVVATGAGTADEVPTGSDMALYVRVRYDAAVTDPLIGLSVKSRDGTLLYGTHSGWLQSPLSPGVPGTTAVYKFSVRMDLAADDWFIDVAVAASQTEILDTREALVHVRTTSSAMSTGVAWLQTTVTEVTADGN